MTKPLGANKFMITNTDNKDNYPIQIYNKLKDHKWIESDQNPEDTLSVTLKHHSREDLTISTEERILTLTCYYYLILS